MWYPDSSDQIHARDTSTLADHLDTFSHASLVVSDRETAFGGSRKDIVETAGKLHDFGKVSPGFQQHIHDKPVDGVQNHSPISAVVTLYALDTLDWNNRDQLLGFLAVSKHHGDIPNAKSYLENFANLSESAYEEIETQISEIDQHDLATTHANRLLSNVDDSLSWNGFRDWVELNTSEKDALKGFRQLQNRFYKSDAPLYEKPRDDLITDEFYGSLIHIWGCLCLIDRVDASRNTTPIPDLLTGKHPDTETVEKHVASLGNGSDIDDLRDDAYRTVLQNTGDFIDSSDRLAEITLPTGTGKTLTGMTAALKIRDELPGNGRLIYALPFTSVINQTANELKSIFGTDENGSIDNQLVTIHHHLAETKINSTGESPRTEYLLGESWRAGYILTTFVQFFESLLGPTPSEGFKIPALENSVILIDEPQAIPAHLRPLVERLFETLTQQFNARIVLMTATPPNIATSDDFNFQTRELVDAPEQYFDQMDRVKFNFHDSTANYIDGDDYSHIPYHDAATELANSVNDGQDTLAICNTKKSARRLYHEQKQNTSNVTELGTLLEDVYADLKTDYQSTPIPNPVVERELVNRVDNASPEQVFVHLTSLLRPKDQSILLTVTETLLEEDVTVSMVSTQIVEAGVDVSFNVVFRDMAPVDSIVQTAGRCNRNGLGGDTVGDVVIWRLPPYDSTTTSDDDSRKRYPSEKIYDRGISYTGHTADVFNELLSDDLGIGSDWSVALPESEVTYAAVQDFYTILDQREGADKESVADVDASEGFSLADISFIDTDGPEVVIPMTPYEQGRVDGVLTDVSENGGSESFGEFSEIRVSATGYSDAVNSGGLWVDDIDADIGVVGGDSRQYSCVYGLFPLEVSSFPSTPRG